MKQSDSFIDAGAGPVGFVSVPVREGSTKAGEFKRIGIPGSQANQGTSVAPDKYWQPLSQRCWPPESSVLKVHRAAFYGDSFARQ